MYEELLDSKIPKWRYFFTAVADKALTTPQLCSVCISLLEYK